MRAKSLLLLIGILVGVAVAVVFPQLRDRLLPASLRQPPTEGVIEGKRLEEGRLLLTVVTSEGAVLATFTQRLAEIDLLVAKGDTVGLALDGYRPFVDDPEIVRVQKAAFEPFEPPVVEPPVEPPVEAQAEAPAEEDAEAEAGQPPAGTAPAPVAEPAPPAAEADSASSAAGPPANG